MSLATDLRFGCRQLLKAPGFTATAVIALALGIGATTAMFGVIYAFLLRPLPFAEPGKLVVLQSRSTKSGADLGVNYLDFKDWREQAQSFADVAFFNLRWNGNLRSDDGATETLKTTFTTANLFTLLGVEPVVGRNFLPADNDADAPRVLLISHRVWQRSFGGSESVIGREVNLDGEMRTVIGVMPKEFRFPTQTDLWAPAERFFAASAGTSRSWRADQAIGRLKPGVSVGKAEAELKLIAERLAVAHADTNKEVTAAVVPLRQHWSGEARGSLVLLVAACGGVLLIACANVGQLLLARATSRQRELLVRAALGASRGALARQLLTESALLTALGALGGVVLAYWLTDIVAAAIAVELPFWIRIDVDAAVLAFTVVVSAVCALLAGSLPALRATRVDVAESLKRSGAGNTGSTEVGNRARDILTVTQVAVSVLLLVGAGLMLRSMMNLTEVNPGFDARQVLVMEVNPTYRSSEPPQARVDRYTRLVERVARIPGVASAASNNSPPFYPQRPWNRSLYTAEGQSLDEQATNPRANFQTVSPDYFNLLRIPLRRGRAFDERDKLGSPLVCIVSESLGQRLWPGQDPLGRRLMLGRPEGGEEPDWMEVVGVVGDVRHQALEREAGPDLYKPAAQLAWKQVHFVVRAQDGVEPMSLVQPIRREVAAIEPETGVFNFVSLGDEVANSLWQPRLRAWLLGFFSVVALLLAATGLYGVLAYRVTQRTREIGIRMALGATRSAVLRLILSQSMRAVFAGIALGIGGALLLSRVLQASLYGVSQHDLASYAAACALLALTALLAAWLPARRASNADPVKALRTD
jgi:putative ABC transport system permease protein